MDSATLLKFLKIHRAAVLFVTVLLAKVYLAIEVMF